MPLNPNIALEVRPPQIEDTASILQRVAQASAARQNAELGPLRAQREVQQIQQEQELGPLRVQNERQRLESDAALAPLRIEAEKKQIEREGLQIDNAKIQQDALRQQQEDQSAFSKAWMESGGDPDEFIKIASKSIRNPEAMARVYEHSAKANQYRETADAKKAQTLATTMRGFAEGLQGVLETKDEESKRIQWGMLADKANALKGDDGKPIFGQSIDRNTVPSDETIKGLQNYVARGTGYWDAVAKQKENAEKVKGAEESARLRVDQRVGRILGASTNQEQWDKGLAELTEEERQGIPKTFSENAKQYVNNRALSAKERADDKLARDRENRIASGGGKKRKDPQEIEGEKNAEMATASLIQDVDKRAVALNKAQEKYEKAIVDNGGQVTKNQRWRVEEVQIPTIDEKTKEPKLDDDGKQVYEKKRVLVSPFSNRSQQQQGGRPPLGSFIRK